MAKGHKCVTVNAFSCIFDPHSRKLNIYLTFCFHFFAMDEAMCDVEFRLSHSASRIRQRTENEVSVSPN